jgi:hypothetical protein
MLVIPKGVYLFAFGVWGRLSRTLDCACLSTTFDPLKAGPSIQEKAARSIK